MKEVLQRDNAGVQHRPARCLDWHPVALTLAQVKTAARHDIEWRNAANSRYSGGSLAVPQAQAASWFSHPKGALLGVNATEGQRGQVSTKTALKSAVCRVPILIHLEAHHTLVPACIRKPIWKE